MNTTAVPTASFDVRPLTPITDDGNRWVTGGCWLYCRREGVRVLWVGPAHTPRGQADMYACETCMAELTFMVQRQLRERDLRDLIPR